MTSEGVRSTVTSPQRQSRYQVRVAAAPAWAADDKGTLFWFDGLRFSRCRRRDDSFAVVPAWQTPHFGWLSLPERSLPAAATAMAPGRSAADPQPHLAA
jgi:hypothetical protein